MRLWLQCSRLKFLCPSRFGGESTRLLRVALGTIRTERGSRQRCLPGDYAGCTAACFLQRTRTAACVRVSSPAQAQRGVLLEEDTQARPTLPRPPFTQSCSQTPIMPDSVPPEQQQSFPATAFAVSTQAVSGPPLGYADPAATTRRRRPIHGKRNIITPIACQPCQRRKHKASSPTRLTPPPTRRSRPPVRWDAPRLFSMPSEEANRLRLRCRRRPETHILLEDPHPRPGKASRRSQGHRCRNLRCRGL